MPLIPYKDDNPTRNVPYLTIGIIILNIAVFVLQLTSRTGMQNMAYDYGAIPHSLLTLESRQPVHPALTIFSSMFMHGGFLHIGSNMLYLWIFGNNIEDRIGPVRFIIFYLFCGIGAAFAHAITNPDSTIPMIGASGAVSGILGAYMLLFPRANVHTLLILGIFITKVKIPALFVIGLWVLVQFINSVISAGIQNAGGVAWFAHLGGFLLGLLTIKIWLPKKGKLWS